MSDTTKEPSEAEVMVMICGLLGAGVATAGFFVMLGLMMSKPHPPSLFALQALGDGIGESIGEGIAHAACIEQRGRWFLDECRFEDDK